MSRVRAPGGAFGRTVFEDMEPWGRFFLCLQSEQGSPWIGAVVWISAIVRIVICLFPQNNWCTEEGNPKLSVIRNAVFAVTGIGIILLYFISGNTYGYHMTRMVAAILLSFSCYIPVTLFSKTKPKVSLLMIPKTCAYMWMIVMGLQLLF